MSWLRIRRRMNHPRCFWYLNWYRNCLRCSCCFLHHKPVLNNCFWKNLTVRNLPARFCKWHLPLNGMMKCQQHLSGSFRMTVTALLNRWNFRLYFEACCNGLTVYFRLYFPDWKIVGTYRC